LADVHTKEQRSFNMSRIRGSDTNPEIILRKALWNEGFRYTKKNKDIPGKPDLAFRKKRLVVFIDGCFWHRCPQHFKQPANNAEFWQKKIQSNIERDEKVNRMLQTEGWKVIRIWEHDVRSNFDKTKQMIIKALHKTD
jgi:DNA mismatch endonuclease (patch repair protein)